MRWTKQVGIAGVAAVLALFAIRSSETVRGMTPAPLLALLAPVLPAPSAPAAPAGRPGGGAPPVVETVVVSTGVITDVAEAVGTTRAFESVAIASKIAGVVESIKFNEGANVVAGQELLRIDSAERLADLEANRAAITQEEAKRNELRTKLDRAIQLRRSGAGTEALVDDLTAQVKTSDSAIQNAKAKERASKARLDDAVVQAPFAGRVGIRQISLGAYLDTRTVITTLDDITKLRVDFQVPENLSARLRQGAAVDTRSSAHGLRSFKGEVAVIDTRIDPVTRSVKLTAIVPNADLALRPGMFMNVALEVARRENAVLIPEEALVGEGPLQLAFVIKDNRVERRIVKTGQREAGKVEITEGLQAGEAIVVRGLQRVRGGMTVNARPLGSAPAAPGSASPPRSQPQAAAPASAAPSLGAPAAPSQSARP
jgi:membrane fusion protein, multidrug efflux system